MQRTDHSPTGTPRGRAGGPVDGADVRRIVGFVALVSASFDGALRQLDPGLTLSQYAALDAVSRAGRLRPFRLANQQRISRQLAWQTCKRLESLGLVAICGLEDGKRGVEVLATPAGTEHLENIGALIDRLAARLSEPGPKGERFDVNPTRRGLRLLAHAAGALQSEGEAADRPDGPEAPHVAATPPPPESARSGDALLHLWPKRAMT